jgi:hypothetical protein
MTQEARDAWASWQWLTQVTRQVYLLMSGQRCTLMYTKKWRTNMTQDEIIKMAWDSGAYTHRITTWGFSLENLERFAAAIAAKEREACAKVCDDEANDDTQDEWQACNCCSYLADKLRARGEA